MLTLSRTRAFRKFQRTVGNCTAHINTAFVGTELIARGAQKPPDLRIRYQAPKDPRRFVEQTCSLLHSAMLGHIFTALDRYLRDLADENWIPLSKHQREILSKAVTKPRGRAYSCNERFGILDVSPDQNAKTDGLLVDILVIWRNRSVHEEVFEHNLSENLGEAQIDSSITAKARADLRKSAAEFSSRYGELSIDELLTHLDRNMSPTRKDIVALASATQNYVRYVDNNILKRVIRSQNDLKVVAYQELESRLVTSDLKVMAKLWGKDVEARMRRINSILQESGFTSHSECIQFNLPEDFISVLASAHNVETAIKSLKQNLHNADRLLYC